MTAAFGFQRLLRTFVDRPSGRWRRRLVAWIAVFATCSDTAFAWLTCYNTCRRHSAYGHLGSDECERCRHAAELTLAA